jgi:hypothetical protein
MPVSQFSSLIRDGSDVLIPLFQMPFFTYFYSPIPSYSKASITLMLERPALHFSPLASVQSSLLVSTFLGTVRIFHILTVCETCTDFAR